MTSKISGTGETAFIDSLVIARAYENECCVVFVNAAGPAHKDFIGRSAVGMPFQGAVCRMEEPNERLEVVEVDLDMLSVSLLEITWIRLLFGPDLPLPSGRTRCVQDPRRLGRTSGNGNLLVTNTGVNHMSPVVQSNAFGFTLS